MNDESAGEQLNLDAYLALEGFRPRIARALADLLNSDVPIAPEVRKKMAAALIKSKDEPGIRLRVEGVGSGESDNIGALKETRRRWLIAGQRIAELHHGGVPIEEAKRKLGKGLIDDAGRHFGLRPTQASNAWAYYKEWLTFRDTAACRKTTSLIVDAGQAEAHAQLAFILNTLRPEIERIYPVENGSSAFGEDELTGCGQDVSTG